MLKFSEFSKLNLMDQMNSFNWKIDIYNDLVLLIEIFICIFSLYLLCSIFFNKKWKQNLGHWMLIEFVWTLLPALILFFLGFPSLKMLYQMETFNFSSNITLKVLGSQWYWEYSFPEFYIQYLSYPIQYSEYFRLAECDILILPFMSKIRCLISSNDVLHSWSIPSLGFKLDACPGRLNFILFMSKFPGTHIGQCSELCGTLHSWMPIMLEFTSTAMFMNWMKAIS